MDKFLSLCVAGIVVIVFILLMVLLFLMYKEKMQKKSNKDANTDAVDEVTEKKARKSLFKFMEFDTVEDNMIVQDGGQRYLMVIECKGVNYDLLSNVEKTAVEQGFIGFMNALKFEIQLYVQTRKVNLLQSTMKYRERLKVIEMDMYEEERIYQNMLREPGHTKDEILKELKEYTKKKNLYEYSKDIIENTEHMSEDSDLTTKEYYIIVPYYTDEITKAGEFNKREIGSMAFSELYTRATALVGALNECDVRGRILNSQELIELLFISYNREQHDTYNFEDYISQSSFNAFYSVSQDVLEKRMAALDEEIQRKSTERAFDAYQRSSRKRARILQEIKELEQNKENLINEKAEKVIDKEVAPLGEMAVAFAKKELKNMKKERAKIHKQADKTEDNKIEDELIVNEEPKEKKELSPEERARRIKILKKRKLLAEKEAKKNG